MGQVVGLCGESVPHGRFLGYSAIQAEHRVLFCLVAAPHWSELAVSSMAQSVGQAAKVVWYKQCKRPRCWKVKLSPREISKDTLTTP